MLSSNHEGALYFAMAELGGEWRTKGFRKSVVNAVRAWPENTPKKRWVPDAYRVIPETRTVEVIEVGLNAEAKWCRIEDWWWFLDNEGWSLNFYSVQKDTAAIALITDAELGRLMLRRESPDASSKALDVAQYFMGLVPRGMKNVDAVYVAETSTSDLIEAA